MLNGRCEYDVNLYLTNSKIVHETKSRKSKVKVVISSVPAHDGSWRAPELQSQLK